MGILFSLLKKFRRSQSQRPPASRRLVLEQLEDRLCPSATVIDLGTLGGTNSNAAAVNESGQVVGTSDTAAGTGYHHAFLWQNGAMTDLGTLGGVRSSAADINNTGQIVGNSTPAGSTPGHAFLWQNGVMTDLGTLGGDSSSASAINNSGQIVGYSKTADGDFCDFVWESGVMYDLNNLLAANSGWQLTGVDKTAINDNGQIAGTGWFNGQQRAFRLTDDDGIFANGGATIADLGTLGGVSSGADSINNLGQVVGSSGTKDGRWHAFRYSADAITDLKTLIGNPTLGENISRASSINDAGKIVGTSIYDPWTFPTATYHAVIWQSGKISDLNKQLPRGSAWVLTTATDINGTGQIVGQGSIVGQRHAFLMVSGSGLQAESVSTEPVTETVDMDQVQPLLDEAIARWQAAGADTSSLGSIQVHIADLPGTTLAIASGNTIWLDVNAGGWGWFVDSTPANDLEFSTDGDQGEQGRIDLLTVLMHEIGHLLGHEHETDGVMAETLGEGTRSSPASDGDTADAVQSLYSIDVSSKAQSVNKNRNG